MYVYTRPMGAFCYVSSMTFSDNVLTTKHSWWRINLVLPSCLWRVSEAITYGSIKQTSSN